MSSYAKIYLSEQEQQLMYNAEWILTKRMIIDRIVELFGALQVSMETLIIKHEKLLPPAITESRAKITRGENYLGLPYVILDYPKVFKNENIFAIRTMFWWGNFFSVTLHISGFYKETFEQHIEKKLQQGGNDLFICSNKDQWQHHFREDNYTAVNKISGNEIHSEIAGKDFVKVAIKFPLQQWRDADEAILNAFAGLLELVKP